MHSTRPCRSLIAALGLSLAGAAPISARAQSQIAAVPEQTADQAWAELKGDTYDQRDHFVARDQPALQLGSTSRSARLRPSAPT